MQQDLDIAVGPKDVPLLFQRRRQFAIVIDLSIADQNDRAVLVEHRLMAAFEIDDPQPLESKPDVLFSEVSGRVRAAMNDGVGHPDQNFPFHSTLAAQVEVSDQTTHNLLSYS